MIVGYIRVSMLFGVLRLWIVCLHVFLRVWPFPEVLMFGLMVIVVGNVAWALTQAGDGDTNIVFHF